MIVIPMAGLSSRFFNAGYTQPKYMLKAQGKPLFDHALLSFSTYFSDTPFLFIVRELYDTPAFVTARCHALGIKNFHIVTLTNPTRGQAETVYLALDNIPADEPLTIFNIDTFRPGFTLPAIAHESDGYLEVFHGEGSNWSYAKAADANSTQVVATAEKQPISNLCSTGLYHFRRCADFCHAFETEVARPQSEWQKQELYIAPLYNHLIGAGKAIHYHLISADDVIFCGVPAEYQALLAKDDN
ncbi:glycosyltransferase family 2 protein [Shewanella sp. YIC-542]|uniref:glycosyltransferase family 2 protein n=1 Tax=Shewanella mytili TaxID=3377111 RepID=UPI00398F1B79